MAVRERLTAAEFDHIASLPENREKRLEYIGGEIVEVGSNNYASQVAGIILFFVQLFIRERGIGGSVTGADGGYIVSGERYIPDVAYISLARQPQPSHEAYNPNPPDLAVEVLSPTDDPASLRIKVVNYLRAGTTVWVVDPIKKQLEVYVPGEAPQTLTAAETLKGDPVLPGFAVPVNDLFPES